MAYMIMSVHQLPLIYFDKISRDNIAAVCYCDNVQAPALYHRLMIMTNILFISLYIIWNTNK